MVMHVCNLSTLRSGGKSRSSRTAFTFEAGLVSMTLCFRTVTTHEVVFCSPHACIFPLTINKVLREAKLLYKIDIKETKLTLYSNIKLAMKIKKASASQYKQNTYKLL